MDIVVPPLNEFGELVQIQTQVLGLPHQFFDIVLVECLGPLLPKLGPGALGHKHADAPFLVQEPGTHQQVDALVGGGGVDLIGGGILGDGWHLTSLGVGPGED